MITHCATNKERKKKQITLDKLKIKVSQRRTKNWVKYEGNDLNTLLLIKAISLYLQSVKKHIGKAGTKQFFACELTIIRQGTQVGKGNQHVQYTDKFSQFVQASHVFADFTQKFRYHPASVSKIKKISSVAVCLTLKQNRLLLHFPTEFGHVRTLRLFSGRNLHRVEKLFLPVLALYSKRDGGCYFEMIYFYQVAVDEPSHKMGTGLTPVSKND